jgi:hypothetical protein
MKLLIQFPTRNRPIKFLNVLKIYNDLLSDNENYFINVSCDVDDQLMNNNDIKNEISKLKNTRLVFNQNKSKIEAINNGFSDIEYDIILLASDDMVPEIKNYDEIIRDEMKKNFVDTDGILWFNDGNHGDNLNTLCILGKKYYDRFNYIYNPEYKSLWSDNEFTIVGNMLKKQVYNSKVIIRHKHHSVDKSNEFDSLYQRNETHYGDDFLTFKRRQEKNFYL